MNDLPPPTNPPTNPPSAPPPAGGAQWAAPGSTTPTPVVVGTATPSRRSPGKVAGLALGVVALLAAGTFAVVKISGNGDDGGAASPSEVGTGLTTALDNEDLLGVVDLLLPGERETFREPLLDVIDNLKRLEVLDSSADPSKIGGLDITVTDVEVREEATNVDDIAHVYVSGRATVAVDGEKVPLGRTIIDDVLGGERPDLDQPEQTEDFDDLMLTTVRRDGRWYLSLFYSVAEQARGDRDIPEKGITPSGGSTPQGAFDAIFDAVEAKSLTQLLAALDPDELGALQRYAPLFVDDAQAELDEAEFEISITDREYSVEGSGSRRTVGIDAFTVTVTNGDQEEISVAYADGCITVTVDGESQEPICPNDPDSGGDALSLLDGLGLGLDSDDATEAGDALTDAFDDFSPRGFAVHQVDGQWYFSPLRSGLDVFVGLLKALDREELQGLIQAANDAAESIDEIAVPPTRVSLPRVSVPTTAARATVTTRR